MTDADECECCDGPLAGEQFYAELEYPPVDDSDVGYFSGYLCRECADDLAATVLDDLGGCGR